MGGSGEDPNKGTNGSAGGVVCVQQRNESQWPGKILGPAVIPEGSAPAPRSGKLLGTDDANVDWYKLEQSKRSKAFHFGKHDHDIKKVEAFASNSAESQDSDGNLSSSEDNLDSVEECEKLRGLEDLGMNVEPSPLLKRKSSQFSLNQELLLLLKNKNRQHALMKVLKHTKMVSVHVGEQLPSPNRISLSELEGSRKNDWASNGDISIITESEPFGNLYDVPLVAEEKCSAGLPSIISDAPQQSSQSSHVHTSSLSSEENESSPTGSKGTLAWRSKGKRNSRSRKSDRLFDEEVAGTHAAAVWGREVDSMDTGPRPIIQIRPIPFRQSRFTVNPKYDPSGFSIHPDHAAGRCLYDINIEVRSSCRSDRVPYISLVSKLTGCPIVGYPLTIEVLDDDDDGISGYHYNSSKDGGGSRVRKHRAVDRPHRKHWARGLLGRSLKSRKSNGPLSKKTRRLTSFTGAHSLSRGVKKPLPVEMARGATVACVPLNVVFSRMNADLSSLV